MTDKTNDPCSEQLHRLLIERKLTLATAESCTGGKISATLTAHAGSSAYFKGGIVAYSNEAKVNLLKVTEATLAQYGAVSEQTVREMAAGAIQALHADCAIAVSGIAGPDGGTPAKPVGTIWIAVQVHNDCRTQLLHGNNNRAANIQRTTTTALSLLQEALRLP